MLSSCYNYSENFCRELLGKTNVTRDNPIITDVVCMPVTPAKHKEVSRSFQNLLQGSGST
jgi:hypothetical protein